jgi:hypothetical protein
MMRKNRRISAVSAGLLLISAMIPGGVSAQDRTSISTGVDLMNRYVWRGLDIAGTPSIQPSLSVSSYGFELGVWGAYTLSNQASESDEVDLWLSYSYGFENEASVCVLMTDYYYPNTGAKFFNFNDYENSDPGAHILEMGISFTGPASLPLTVSGYVNVHNDPGNNTYFQIDYPFRAGETELGLFCGFTGGSEDNPEYYGTKGLNVINLGLSAERGLEISDRVTLPVSVAFIVNPRAETPYLVAGLSF